MVSTDTSRPQRTEKFFPGQLIGTTARSNDQVFTREIEAIADSVERLEVMPRGRLLPWLGVPPTVSPSLWRCRRDCAVGLLGAVAHWPCLTARRILSFLSFPTHFLRGLHSYCASLWASAQGWQPALAPPLSWP